MTPRDGLWLSIAVIVHAGLLLAPVDRESPDRRFPARPLLIELHNPASVERPFEEEEPVVEPVPARPPETWPEPLAPATELAAQDEDDTPVEPEPVEVPETSFSTAVLLQSAADRKWPVPPEETHRRLGVFVPPDTPPNWKPAFLPDDNLFNGMTVPRRVEVVDRWTSPDGTYNVVVNTPGGDTLCGRGKAWDPMQPLIEHVVQFSTCGGGGQRTFAWPDRYRSNADNGTMANSTTN